MITLAEHCLHHIFGISNPGLRLFTPCLVFVVFALLSPFSVCSPSGCGPIVCQLCVGGNKQTLDDEFHGVNFVGFFFQTAIKKKLKKLWCLFTT